MSLGRTVSDGGAASSAANARQFAEHLASVDEHRKNFIEDLIENLATQENKIASLELELDDQRNSRIQYQQQARVTAITLRGLQQKLDRDAFVAVLIDGDGAKFTTELLQNGEAGGVEAAQRLKQAIRQHLGQIDPALLSDEISIVVKIWANLDGLATSLYYDGSITARDPKQHLRTFAEAFSRSRAEFDFVNVGKGKENADSKMRKLLAFYYKLPQCKYILFAGCHDKGYLHDLGDKRGDEGAAQRIFLLETTPAEPGFQQLGFPLVQFNSVFRSTPLVNEQKRLNTATSMIPPPKLNLEDPTVFGSSTPSKLERSRDDITSSAVSSPIHQSAMSPMSNGQALVARGPSPGIVTASGNGGVSISYASAGGPTNQNVVIRPKKKDRPKTILCNINEERLDPPNTFIPMSHPAQASYQGKLDSIKPKVLCNEHYLVGDCFRGELCSRAHDVSLTPDEKKVHAFKARTSECPVGVHCDNYDCYLSHSCPLGPSCKRGKSCKFSLHFTTKEDLKPVYRWIEGQEEPETIS